MPHTPLMSYLVGIVFTLLIFGGPVVVSLFYGLIAGGGTWTTFFRRTYPHAEWESHPRVAPLHH